MYRKSILTVVCLLAIAGVWSVAQGQEVPFRISDKQVEQSLKRLKKDSDKFRKDLDSALDRSRLDGTNREDDINAFVKNFDRATTSLHERFKDHKSVSADVQTVLDSAARIDQFMRRQQFRNGKAERDWSVVRGDLDQLSQEYNVTWNWGV